MLQLICNLDQWLSLVACLVVADVLMCESSPLASCIRCLVDDLCRSQTWCYFAAYLAVQNSHVVIAGAAALEKLDLVPINAVALYQEYDEDVGDPLKTFVMALNHAGTFLGAPEREQLFSELPSAFQKTSLLLTSLAVED